jgi:Spx/MgsR family transcriptional regulator
MSLSLYGIKSCDTVKKARAWLDGQGVAYAFHDYKALGVDEAMLRRWCAGLGWEKVINRAGTTFRGLPDTDKQDLTEVKAIRLMHGATSLIKRPILEGEGVLLAGFSPGVYEAALRSARG